MLKRLSYNKEELGVMCNACESLLNAKNRTELKQYKKALISYMGLLSNFYPHLKLDKPIDVIEKVTKHVLVFDFPATVIYDIDYKEVEK